MKLSIIGNYIQLEIIVLSKIKPFSERQIAYDVYFHLLFQDFMKIYMTMYVHVT